MFPPPCPFVALGDNLIVGFENPKNRRGIILPDGVDPELPKYFTLVKKGPAVTADLEVGDQIYPKENWPLPGKPSDPWIFFVVPSDKVAARGERLELK